VCPSRGAVAGDALALAPRADQENSSSRRLRLVNLLGERGRSSEPVEPAASSRTRSRVAALATVFGADLICGANVLAQVPDVNDFRRKAQAAPEAGGVVTIEFAPRCG